MPFNPESVNVPRRYRALSYLNRTLGRREEASLLHVAQRVSVDAQWATLDIHRRTRAFAQALELNLLPT